MDLMGLGLLVLVGFGWGKPVPFNPYNLKLKRWGPVVVGLAGPLANLLSVFLFALVLKAVLVTHAVTQDSAFFTFITFLIEINVVLMVFNLIPIPPLDGSKLLYSFLGVRHLSVIAWLEQYGIWLLLALILLGSPWLSLVFDWVIHLVYTMTFIV